MKNVRLINNSLNNEIKDILENNLKVTKGEVGGFSIEVDELVESSYSSYIYKNEEDRDSDLKTIEELLK